MEEAQTPSCALLLNEPPTPHPLPHQGGVSRLVVSQLSRARTRSLSASAALRYCLCRSSEPGQTKVVARWKSLRHFSCFLGRWRDFCRSFFSNNFYSCGLTWTTRIIKSRPIIAAKSIDFFFQTHKATLSFMCWARQSGRGCPPVAHRHLFVGEEEGAGARASSHCPPEGLRRNRFPPCPSRAGCRRAMPILLRWEFAGPRSETVAR
jgi:hypothetical protein